MSAFNRSRFPLIVVFASAMTLALSACGNDGATTTCVDNRSQSGFVISPAGSFILNETPPLLYRPDGGSPFAKVRSISGFTAIWITPGI